MVAEAYLLPLPTADPGTWALMSLPKYAPGAYCGLGGDHAGDWSHRRTETFKSMANSGS